MEQPLSIANFQREYILFLKKELKPANITELCWQIRPYVVLYQIGFTGTALSFSDRDMIPFSEVIDFWIKRGMLVILLKNGTLCLLSDTTNKIRYIRIGDPEYYAKTGVIRPRWLTVFDNIQLFWWETKEYINKALLS